MTLTRSLRRWISGMLLFAVLFAQLATAAHACSKMSPVERSAVLAMPCDGPLALDADQAALCLEHCKAGAQTVDAGHAPTLAAPALLFAVLAFVEPSDGDRPAFAAHARERDHAPRPAHSIVHCCWRI